MTSASPFREVKLPMRAFVVYLSLLRVCVEPTLDLDVDLSLSLVALEVCMRLARRV